jgi:O-methyltransferase involved in polyketide biosynthesis
MISKSEPDDDKFRELMPTAILTAYPRTFSDIPYSQEIFDELSRYHGDIDEELLVDRLAVELEARSKLIDKLIATTKTTQILELAAGFSSRGLTFTQRPDAKYVEIDLPELIQVKERVVSRIIDVPSNLTLLGGNALRGSDYDQQSATLTRTNSLWW